MRAVILVTLGALLLPAAARAQSDEPLRQVEGGFIEPGWFAVVEGDRSPMEGRFVKEVLVTGLTVTGQLAGVGWNWLA